MINHDAPGELKKRAETLRSCARRARTAARAMGTFLDREVKQATGYGDGLIWSGPYATNTIATLKQRKADLQRMAADLTADAGRWEKEAERLEERARGKRGGH
ncbi:hypothetical protein [Streptomyces natalensis]|uniref:Uncharacterized protein n=1 Tax=Streptomyces natalensis ATCC 27448 TaxID=1240678 RepID=A0A0D7CGM6_9ACTN|nr:hypothetical protein [Streptomyces natalensis]KIZ15419.1 hypothetical protein SNA_28105 [Streptomyces natalensis ATCC 27448]